MILNSKSPESRPICIRNGSWTKTILDVDSVECSRGSFCCFCFTLPAFLFVQKRNHSCYYGSTGQQVKIFVQNLAVSACLIIKSCFFCFSFFRLVFLSSLDYFNIIFHLQCGIVFSVLSYITLRVTVQLSFFHFVVSTSLSLSISLSSL